MSFPLSEADAPARVERVGRGLSPLGELTSRMARGDEAAFGVFFERYFDRLLRYLFAIARGDEDLARDALQDAMTRVARHIRRFDDEQVFWSWLTVLARSAARDAGRRRSRYRGLLARFRDAFIRPKATPSADSAAEELTDALHAALAALPAADRKLIEAKYFQAASVRELAQAHKQTEKAVESRLLRARRKLRTEIDRQLKQS